MIGDAVRWTRSEVSDKSCFLDCYSMAACHDSTNGRLIRCDRDNIRDTRNSQSSCSNDLAEEQQSIVASVDHYQYHHREQCGSDLQLQHSRRQPPRKRPPFLSFSRLVVVILHSFLVSLACATRFCSTLMASPVAKRLSVSRHGPYKIGGSSIPTPSTRLFVKFLLVFLQVYALSTSFVIGSVQASNDFSTSWDKKFRSDETSSVYDNGGDSDFSGKSVVGHYTPTWAVHIPDGDVDGKADQVARDHGFINHGKIFDDHYHFHHNSISKRSIDASHHHQRRLQDDDRVRWSRQQQIKSRKKRDFIRMRPARTSSVSRIELNDPKWPQMWYLNRGNGLDMNVIPAWEQGITGKGVVVTILDDGLESDHPDIEHNYDPKASYDVNSHDDDPMPHYDMTDSNRHGTRCAGEVAATANNSLCSVGIAYGARVGGVRMLDGDVTDAVEARSLSLNPQHIDIYSASWGPDDDGKTVDGPGELATRAFIEGVTKGRGGKGSIFIWASGNGGRELDNCNCDGYTNSIWTLSISSATEEGHVPWYSEKCSSTLAATYSSGGQNEKQVVTTDLHHSCTTSHTGTSASAPLAAGIVALVLEANRNLTWRDLQHIVVRTAKPGNLLDQTWTKNGVGRRISHSFGYGLMDAAAMVKVARTWQTVPEQQRCEINAPHLEHMIPAKRYITLQLDVQHCMGVNFLEHVQAKISLTSQRRGDIVIYLQSPAGTRVTLLTSRVHDVSRSGFNEWPFMSVHTWGEAPHGKWLLEVHNEGRFLAQITQWDIIFYGTDKPPQPDDPIQIRPGPFGSYGGDLDNNFLDPDPETMGQWRDMQQVGESHIDVQRTTKDQTNSACTNFIADQRCIECTSDTFLYKERCWSHCPERSYMVPEVPRSRNRNNNINDHKTMNVRSIDTGNSSRLIANSDSMPTKRAVMPLMPQKKCASCHVSCLFCRGPEAFQCLQCHPGNHLTMVSSDETYCYPAPNGNNLSRATGRVSPNENTEDGNLMQDLNAFWSIVVPSLTVIVLVVGLSIAGRYIISRWRNDATHSYEKVAFDATNEDLESISTEHHEQPSRIKPGTSGSYDHRRILVESSSDSDDDL